MREEKVFFPLDFIKVIAVLIIILFHFLSSVENGQLLYDPNVYKIGNISLLNLGGVNIALGNYGISLLFISAGMSLMYAYQNKMDLREFYERRLLAIYPLYYVTFIMASFFQVFLGYRLNERAPLWTLVWTVLGIDNWIGEFAPTYGLIGDGFLSCLIFIYVLFPILYKCMNKNPHITIGIYALIFLLWEYVYPFDFPKTYSIILRTFEVLLGIYIIKTGRRITWRGVFISVLLLGVIFVVKVPFISTYFLATIAGISLTVLLCCIAEKIKSGRIQRIIIWLKRYSFATFLIHHFLLNVILKNMPKRSLTVSGMLTLFLVYMSVIWLAGVVLKKIEINLMDDSTIKKVFKYQ